jgi:hypothetical protein
LAAAATATLTAGLAGAQLLGIACQNTIATNSLFASFSTAITKIRQGTSVGIDNPAVLDTAVPKNASNAFGAAGNPTAGNVALTGNFTGSGKTGVCMIEVPGTVGTATPVTVNAEGGRASLTVPYGTLEIWAQPDGLTYDIRTSKP